MPVRPTPPQIYHVLKELKKEEFIYDCANEDVDPKKHVFNITEKGYSMLKIWLNEQDDTLPMDDVVAQKLWYGSFTDKDKLTTYMEAFCEVRELEIKYYQRMKDKLHEKPERYSINSEKDKLYATLALDFLITKGKCEAEFINNALRQITLNEDKTE